MVNVRPHDPWSPHHPVAAAGEGDNTGNDPQQPTSPGQHPPPPIQPVPVEQRGDGLDDMLKSDLVALATEMGLGKSGTKDDLIDRIRADRANSPQ
jgi:hypothetical protein